MHSNAFIIILLAVAFFMSIGGSKAEVKPPLPGQKKKLREAAEQARAGESDETKK